MAVIVSKPTNFTAATVAVSGATAKGPFLLELLVSEIVSSEDSGQRTASKATNNTGTTSLVAADGLAPGVYGTDPGTSGLVLTEMAGQDYTDITPTLTADADQGYTVSSSPGAWSGDYAAFKAVDGSPGGTFTWARGSYTFPKWWQLEAPPSGAAVTKLHVGSVLAPSYAITSLIFEGWNGANWDTLIDDPICDTYNGGVGQTWVFGNVTVHTKWRVTARSGENDCSIVNLRIYSGGIATTYRLAFKGIPEIEPAHAWTPGAAWSAGGLSGVWDAEPPAEPGTDVVDVEAAIQEIQTLLYRWRANGMLEAAAPHGHSAAAVVIDTGSSAGIWTVQPAAQAPALPVGTWQDALWLAFDPFERIADHADRAVNRLAWQFRKPRIEALVRAHAAGTQQLEDALWSVLDGRALSVAVGATLNRWGATVGKTRPLSGAGSADDDVYRSQVYARIAANTANGTPEQILSIMRLLGAQDVLYAEPAPYAAAVVYLGDLYLPDAEVVQLLIDITGPIGWDIKQRSSLPLRWDSGPGLDVGKLGRTLYAS